MNAILSPALPLIDVILQNPFNLQDFLDDKLSILDIEAIDETKAVYHVEMQLVLSCDFVQRIVYYGCELVVDQLKAGSDYSSLRPVYSICITSGVLWPDATKVQPIFRFIDRESGRVLGETLEIHTIELGRYNLQPHQLDPSRELDSWLYLLKHAQDYEAEQLERLFAQPGLRDANRSLIRIAAITEDKKMYDAREKAIRDRRWERNSAFRDGEEVGVSQGG